MSTTNPTDPLSIDTDPGESPERAQDPDDTTEAGAGEQEAPATAPRRTRRTIAVAAAVAVVIAAGGAVAAWATADHRSWVDQTEEYASDLNAAQADADSSRADVTADYDAAITAVNGQIVKGEATLAATDAQVIDNAVRETLRQRLDEAIVLRDTEPDYLTEDIVIPGLTRESRFADGSRPEKTFSVTTETSPSAAALTSAGSLVGEAEAAVLEAQTSWALDQVTQAIANGETVLAGSDGKVGDGAVRDALAAAIATATPVRDAGVDGSTTADLLAQRDAVNAAATVVADAQSVWQTEQDRIATEQAAAAEAAARQAASATTSNSSRSSASSSAGSSTGSGSGSTGTSRSNGSGSSSAGAGNSGSQSGSSGSSTTSPAPSSPAPANPAPSNPAPAPAPAPPAPAAASGSGGVSYDASRCNSKKAGPAGDAGSVKSILAAYGPTYGWSYSGTTDWVTSQVWSCLA